MSFKQIFESEPPPYRLGTDIVGTLLGSINYHQEFLVPPRIYGEEIALIHALYVKKEKTPFSDFTIHFQATTNMVKWPSWAIRHWIFDGLTGVYLGDLDTGVGSAVDVINSVSNILVQDIVEGSDGSLWLNTTFLGTDYFEINPDTFAFVEPTSAIQDSFYGGGGLLIAPLVDRPNNMLIRGGNSGVPLIRVYNFLTGAHIRDIEVSGSVSQILSESNKYVYVVTHQGLINLVDVENGVVDSTFRIPLPNREFTNGVGEIQFAYDKFFKRLLAYEQLASDTDGANLSTIKGWFPVPLATRVTNPIPLIAPREDRQIPCLVRLHGDTGEPVAGVAVIPTIDGPGIETASPAVTDRDGDAIIMVQGDTPGSLTLDVAATIT